MISWIQILSLDLTSSYTQPPPPNIYINIHLATSTLIPPFPRYKLALSFPKFKQSGELIEMPLYLSLIIRWPPSMSYIKLENMSSVLFKYYVLSPGNMFGILLRHGMNKHCCQCQWTQLLPVSLYVHFNIQASSLGGPPVALNTWT